MKIYFCVNKQPLVGYNNINVAEQKVDFGNLDMVCARAECTEIILDDMLEYIPLQQVPGLLVQLITRIRKNGRLIINSLDLNETIKQYSNGLLSIADFNAMIYGNTNIHKCSAFSHTDLHGILVSNGLQSMSIELLTNSFTIIAQRI